MDNANKAKSPSESVQRGIDQNWGQPKPLPAASATSEAYRKKPVKQGPSK
jgi:hypothetical protein